MSTCPTCGANYRTPLNYLNKPCCARARDAENAKRGGALVTISPDLPANPREGQTFYDKATKGLLVWREGAWRPITPKEAQKVVTANLRDMTEKFYDHIQRAMIGAIEEIEGRVPSNGEIRLHGAVKTHEAADGERREVYYWRQMPVFVARFCVREKSQIKHVLECADPDEYPPLP